MNIHDMVQNIVWGTPLWENTSRAYYDRHRVLPGLLSDGEVYTEAELLLKLHPVKALRHSVKTLVKLRRALVVTRKRGRAGSWLYDRNYHINLGRAYASERGLAQVLLDRAKEARRSEDNERPSWNGVVYLLDEMRNEALQ